MTSDAKISEVETRLKKFLRDNIVASHRHSNEDDDSDSDTEDERANRNEPPGRKKQRQFIAILGELFQIVRSADDKESKKIIERVDAIVNRAVKVNNGAGGSYEPRWIFEGGEFDSFAHAEGELIESNEPIINMTEAQYEMFVRFVIGNATTAKAKEKARRKVFGDRKPWDKTIQQPHPSTTLLSHFSDKFSAPWSSPYTAPLAQAVYEARCEISSNGSMIPTNIHISADSNCVVVSCAGGGWKNNEPALDHYVLSDADAFPQCHSVELGLDEITPYITTDVSRRLVFMADEERVKSFRWDDDLPVHTLASGSLRGPIAVLPDGKLVRAGQGKLAVWKLDKQPTHGPDGKKVIGKTMDVGRDREDADYIEPSSGSSPSSKVKLDSALKDWDIENWVAHPSLPGTMITTAKNQCALISIDIAHGGKTGTKYIGQGGMAHTFSTDPLAAPNAFVTDCEDGEIRLWDTRQPLPVLTMEVGRGAMPSVALAHPDGVPTIFGGSVKAEVIKVYDVRGRQLVYELATGNNQVVGLAWDHTRSTLWAATECSYLDPHHDPYRGVELPRYIKSRLPNEDSPVYGRSWPNNAYHRENYFGDIFNIGAHATFRFQFKPDADPSVVPPYSARW